MRYSSINRRKVQRLIKSLEPIYNNPTLTFSKFLSFKDINNEYEILENNYLEGAKKFLKQTKNFYKINNKCIPYQRDTILKVVPHGFTITGDLVNILILDNNKTLSDNIKNEYNKFIKYTLALLNLNRCNTYFVNVTEYKSKKDMIKYLSPNSIENLDHGFNYKNNKYWILNLDESLIIDQNFKVIRSEFHDFIKRYRSNINTPEVVKNFEVDRTTWIKASSTWEPARNDHLVSYLKYHKITSLDNSIPESLENKKRKRCDTWDEQKLSSLSQIFPNTFRDYILNRGNDFENEIYTTLIQKFGSNIKKVGESFQASSKLNYNKTIELMKLGVPILFQPVIQNPLNKTYGCPDLLVRSDYLNKLVSENAITNEEINIPATKLNINYHYRIVDIKSSTLELSSDKEMILNTKTSKPYKMQLLIYNRGLEWMQGYEPSCAYLLSNGWYSKRSKIRYESNDPFNKLSKIDYSQRDYEYNIKLDDTLNFLNRVRTDNTLSYDPPSENIMRPNMKIESDPKYIPIKNALAKKQNDATLVHMVSTENRDHAIAHGINSYLDKDCTVDTLGITGKKKRHLIDKLLRFNQQPYDPSLPIIPKKIQSNMFNWKSNNKLEFYIDFETIGYAYIDDDKKRQYIFMIGIGYLEPNNRNWNFKSLYVEEQTKEEELRILTEMNNFINKLNNKYNTIGNIYHWSPAETIEYKKAQEEFPTLNNLQWCDLLQLFKKETILVHGNISGFGLKKIAKQMKKLNLINTVWDSNSQCMHGMDAMHLGWKYYQNNKQDTHIFEEIKKYNEIDCLTMKDIVLYLRNNNI